MSLDSGAWDRECYSLETKMTEGIVFNSSVEILWGVDSHHLYDKRERVLKGLCLGSSATKMWFL